MPMRESSAALDASATGEQIPLERKSSTVGRPGSHVSTAEDVRSALFRKRLKKRFNDAKTSWQLWGIVIVCAWLLGGCIFYGVALDWPVSAAFYFAAQSGLSVGFGIATYNLSDLSLSDGVMFFTTVFVLLGSSFVGAALALFVSSLMEKQDAYYKDELKELRLKEVKRLEMKKKGSRSRYAFFMCALNTGVFVKKYKMFLVSFFLFLIWIVAGVVFGMVYEDYTFWRALLFATAALSTGGLIGVSSTTPAMWFTGFYVLTGVPVYAFVLGNMAGALVERQERQKFRDQISQTITKQEFEFAQALGNDDGLIDEHEFVLMSLLRMGKVDQDQLERIRARFQMLDVDGDGSFSRRELHVSLAFDKFDEDGSGSLDREEFAALCFDLSESSDGSHGIRGVNFSDLDEIYEIFDRIDTDDSGVIGRDEFFAWWSSVAPPEDDAERALRQPLPGRTPNPVPTTTFRPLDSETEV